MLRTLLGLLLALLLTCAPVAAQGRHVDAEHGFSLNVPAGWSGTNGPTRQVPGALLSLQSGDRSCVFLVRTVEAGGASPDAIEAELTRSACAKGYRVLRRWRGFVAGEPAISMVYESPKGIERNTVVALGQQTWLLQSAAPNRQAYQKAAWTFQNITDSFRPEAIATVPDSEATTRAVEDRNDQIRAERLREDARQERMRQDRIRQERDRQGY